MRNTLQLRRRRDEKQQMPSPASKHAVTPSTATSLNNLAGLYRQKGDFAKAEPLFQRALKIREKALGPLRSLLGRMEL